MIRRVAENYGKILLGWKLWAGALCVFLLFQLDASMPIFFDEYKWNVLKESFDLKIIMMSCIFYGMYIPMMSIVSTIGAGVQFCKEWKSGVVPQMLMKMGLRMHAVLYTILAMFSGGIIGAMGYGIFVAFMNIHVPLYNTSAAQPDAHEIVYAFTMADKTGWQYVLIMGILMFLVGALSAVMALCISTVSDNKYLVMVFPYLVQRGYIELCKATGVPNKYRLDFYLYGRQDIGNSFLEFVVIIFVILLLIAVIGQYFFKKGVRRKLIHGKY